MADLVSVKSYDGTIVRVPREKLQTFKIQQEKIRKMINEGKSLEEIKNLLKKVHYDE